MNDGKPIQLTLGIALRDEARFENYLVTAANRQLVEVLQQASFHPQVIYIRAQKGAGLTHLLQAVCHAEAVAEHPALYLPLSEHAQFAPGILQGVEGLSLLCLDDLDAVAGNKDWERALFVAFNECRQTRTRLVIGAGQAPRDLPLVLADLQSRLQNAPLYRLSRPDDEEKRHLLRLRAGRRGMNLSPAVADYILARTERSVPALMAVLDTLDAVSLSRRRALTIPLVKEAMGW